MKIGAIVQARMDSQRFPGKVLYKVAGKPMLQYLLERLQHCSSLDNIVVATSTQTDDTSIADFCQEQGVVCYRGPLHNVAARFKEVLDVYPFDGFVRVNADAPLLDQCLIDRGVELFLKGDFDMVTNVLPRTYPPGQSVEILRTTTFVVAYELMHEDEDFEHVTKFFYKNAQRFRIFNFASRDNYSKINLSIDTDKDMKVFTAIVDRMNKPHWEYGLDEIIKLYKEVVLYGK